MATREDGHIRTEPTNRYENNDGGNDDVGWLVAWVISALHDRGRRKEDYRLCGIYMISQQWYLDEVK